MSDEHPNDRVIFQSYPDTSQRETYPPLPRRMGNPNAVANEAMVATILSRLPTPLPPVPTPSTPTLPDDPDTDPYRTAGWLS